MDPAPKLDLDEANAKLEPMTALERLAWGAETFGDKLAFLVSMQKTSSIMLHLASRLGLKQEVLFVDTGFHFRQTLQLRDDFMRKLGTNIVT
ncbi:MAG TPA: phosphoadenosine phosphosulfate reductase family protein, partial [Planctomycetia bacterium]|nr:phosphoadenosine phosphosulfate reductase family protein [Planctomycetia bacterium]